MEKAYDFKNLVERFKADGIEMAEEAAKKVIGHAFDWLNESADLSKTPYDDILKVIYPQAKAKVMEYAEDINKADNE